VGSAGAVNAAIFAARMLALTDEGIRTRLLSFKEELSRKVEEKSVALKAKLKK
jgi:phosphoribosylcarboxyaminoimidazole (NCAIR) mutase